jgi:hypothetical protein
VALFVGDFLVAVFDGLFFVFAEGFVRDYGFTATATEKAKDE